MHGAVVLIRNNAVVAMYAVDGFSDKISDVQSFEAEEVPIITALQLLGEQLRGATIFTDSESTYKKLDSMRWKKSVEMHEDPYIATIYRLATFLDVTISFTRGHAEKRKKKKNWSFLDKVNIAADWVTRGLFEDVFTLYGQTIDMTKTHRINFNSNQFITALCNTGVYTFTKDKFPIAAYQMRKLQTKTRVHTYLNHRARTSTRQIDWPSLSLEFAAKIIRKSGKQSKFTLCKLI